MSVDQRDAIDIIGTDPQGYLALTISDHLDWSNAQEHLTLLQAKLNRYSAFLKSGRNPSALCGGKGRPIFCKHRPDRGALAFLTRATRSSNGLPSNSDTEFFAESCANEWVTANLRHAELTEAMYFVPV